MSDHLSADATGIPHMIMRVHGDRRAGSLNDGKQSSAQAKTPHTRDEPRTTTGQVAVCMPLVT